MHQTGKWPSVTLKVGAPVVLLSIVVVSVLNIVIVKIVWIIVKVCLIVDYFTFIIYYYRSKLKDLQNCFLVDAF